MEIPVFFRYNFEKILRLITILLFSEIFTLFFLSIPSDFLAFSFNVLVFYIFFLLYFVLSLIVPWIYIFFSTNSRKFTYILSTSFLSFIIILLFNFFVVIHVQVIIYFILLKSLIVGFSSIFKSIIMLIDRKDSFQKTNFDFQNEKSLELKMKKAEVQKLHRNEFLGGLIFLIIYPLTILLITYFYSFLKL